MLSTLLLFLETHIILYLKKKREKFKTLVRINLCGLFVILHKHKLKTKFKDQILIKRVELQHIHSEIQLQQPNSIIEALNSEPYVIRFGITFYMLSLVENQVRFLNILKYWKIFFYQKIFIISGGRGKHGPGAGNRLGKRRISYLRVSQSQSYHCSIDFSTNIA